MINTRRTNILWYFLMADSSRPSNPSRASFSRVSPRGSLKDQSTDLLTELLESSIASEDSLKEIIKNTQDTVKALTNKSPNVDNTDNLIKTTNSKLDKLIGAVRGGGISGSSSNSSGALGDCIRDACADLSDGFEEITSHIAPMVNGNHKFNTIFGPMVLIGKQKYGIDRQFVHRMMLGVAKNGRLVELQWLPLPGLGLPEY